MDKYKYDYKEFHSKIKKVYFGEYKSCLNKKADKIATVIYDPVHENVDYTDERAGKGKVTSKWIFSEDNGQAENISETGFNLMIDFYMEPNSSIGLHIHDEKEELYYILEGRITLTTIDKDGSEYTEELFPGDAHMVKIGQGHYGVAGKDGVRIITVCVSK